MSFNNVGLSTLSPGYQNRVRWGVLLNGGQDQGAIYVAANPLNPGEIVSFDQSKEMLSDGRIAYNATFWNRSSFIVNFNMQGGGFINGFDLSTGTTLSPGYANRIRWGVTRGGQDQGAIFLEGATQNPGEIISFDEGKLMTPDAQIGYHATLWNNSSYPVVFRAQGGGFINGFDLSTGTTLSPGYANRIRWGVTRGGQDQGAIRVSGNPLNPGEIISFNEGKEMFPDGTIGYHATLWNNGASPVVFSAQGGGFS